ncbi:MAG TPA: peptidylprolyl isomerase [Gammaproteobacteria bacterium]|jgi:peptidyl-prolyl cis-trans isomerase C|nr:peptidylprolyl isomerase [Gammaproteobacteria bacterium]
MRTVSRLMLPVLLGLLALGGLAACHKRADNSGDSAVLATVNGTPITQGLLDAFVRFQAQGQLPELNPVQRASLIKSLVTMELLAQEARKQGLDKQPDVQAQIDFNDSDALAEKDAQDYMAKHTPTDADIKAAFDERMKGFDPHEYKARHILVQDQAQARDIIGQLNKGANFATLAKKYSIDQKSAQNGGELGDWFPPDGMVPSFSAAVQKLKKGEITQAPVQSDYGWHVIQLEDVRDRPVPTLAQMHDQLASEMRGKTFQAHMKQLTDEGKVVIAPAAGTLAGAMPGQAKP